MNELRDLLREKSQETSFDPLIPVELRRRIILRRLGIFAVAVSVAVILVSGGMSLVLERSRVPPVKPPPATSPDAIQPWSPLEPGNHLAASFAVPFAFSTGENWSIRESTREFMAVEYDAEGDVGFHIISNVFSPSEMTRRVDPPKDFIEWIRGHPYLEVVAVDRIVVGNTRGKTLRIRGTRLFDTPNCGGGLRCVPLSMPEGAPTSLQIHNWTRVVHVFEVGGETVVVNTDPRTFTGTGRRLLESVRFMP